LLITALLVMMACTAPNGSGAAGESPERQAVRAVGEQVVAAIQGGTLAEVAWSGRDGEEVATEYAEVVAGMRGEPDVELIGVVSTSTEGTATLKWSWPLGPGEDRWEYHAGLVVVAAGEEWLPLWSPAVIESTLGERSELLIRTEAVDRGEITGADGAVIVTQRPVLRFGIDKTRARPPVAVRQARRLARLLDIDPEAFAQRVRAAGDRAFVEAVTYREEDVRPRVRRGVDDIPAARAISDTRALAPTREFAAPLLGRVGPVTAEMVADHPEKYRGGDIAGVSGLQARYDDQLRGRPGYRVIAFDRGGDERELFHLEAVEPTDLALTLDPALQSAAEELLGPVQEGSALVAIRPSDGAVLAVANGGGNSGLNHATVGRFAPGSTFKIVSSLALLRSGLGADSRVACTDTVTVDGRRFGNYSDYPRDVVGRISLGTALAHSCNTAFISAGQELEDGALADAAASLGLGVDLDLGYPAHLGQVPDPASQTEKAAALIGQGRVLASPLAMATVIAAVRSGERVVPQLVEGIEMDVPDAEPLTGQEVNALRAMLRQAVTEGSARGLSDLPGPPVIAKTGTAEFDGPDGPATHAWMVAAQGDLAVAVFVEIGASGSRAAGPIVADFLREAR
jgi:cell division protein FtsI/penicillin-binding protein 2